MSAGALAKVGDPGERGLARRLNPPSRQSAPESATPTTPLSLARVPLHMRAVVTLKVGLATILRLLTLGRGLPGILTHQSVRTGASRWRFASVSRGSE